MTYKVIQWCSGTVGTHAIKAVAERANLELVGMYAFSDNKVGQDAGTIAGIDALGVRAVNDVNKILDMDADVVLHTPLPSLIYGEDPLADIDTFCSLLESGKDVITTVGYMYPKVHGPELNKRLEDACRAGDSTFHSTGLNPGWMGDLVPITMTALSRKIDQIYVREITNFTWYPSHDLMYGIMGYGKPPNQFEKESKRLIHWLDCLFRENVQMIADALEVVLDEIRLDFEYVLTDMDFQTAFGTVPKGTVAGQHYKFSGMVKDKEFIVHETVWRTHESVAPDWATGVSSVIIEGQPRMQLDFGENFAWIADVLEGTAMHAVNAIPYVCDAPAGIKTFLDLPWIIGKGAA